jgi:hypothetical protein
VMIYARNEQRTSGAKMVPLYAARIEDLGSGDFVKIDCAACCRRLLRSSAELRCSHTALLIPAFLVRLGLEPRQRVLDLKELLRSPDCPVERGEGPESAHMCHPTSSRAWCYRQRPAYRHALPQPRATTAKTVRLLDIP